MKGQLRDSENYLKYKSCITRKQSGRYQKYFQRKYNDDTWSKFCS